MRTITTIEVDGTGKRVIDNAKNRVVVTIVLFAICFTVIAGRLVDLGLLGGEARADRIAGTAEIGQSRGEIVDRNGVLLATDLDVISIGAERHKVLDPADAAVKIASVLPGIVAGTLEQELRAGTGFVWIKRKLTPGEFDAINRLGIPGVEFRNEVERVYPQGPLAAHLVGYANVDGKGIAGIERFFDQRLREEPNGAPLQLAMDVRIQHALRDEISFAISRFGAVGGAGLVLDVHTGEIVAMSSLPDFNPNKPGLDEPFMNQITHGVYEMGSTFKTFTVAMALEKGVIKLGEGYDATKPIRVSRFTIRDDHPQARWLSVPEIFMYSSNIGSAKMAMDAGAGVQRAFLADLGMLRRPDIELHEVGIPQLPASWGDASTMTIAYGHGLAVSGLQLASGFSALVNGGMFHSATVLKADPDYAAEGERVISEDTSRKVQALLRLVVEKGTGRKAEAQGFLVGGKTGTAEKAGRGGYKRRSLITSFVAAFPITDPRYVVFVMLDEPQGTKATHGFAGAGWNAAPTVGRVIERIGPTLGVAPVMETTHPLTEEMMTFIQPEVRS